MICFCTSLSKIFEIADRILTDRILTEYFRESEMEVFKRLLEKFRLKVYLKKCASFFY